MERQREEVRQSIREKVNFSTLCFFQYYFQVKYNMLYPELISILVPSREEKNKLSLKMYSWNAIIQ